jgi:hypothetical protein
MQATLWRLRILQNARASILSTAKYFSFQFSPDNEIVTRASTPNKTRTVPCVQKSTGTTEDELQAAALLISLKDSDAATTPPPAGNHKVAEPDAPQVSWAAFSGALLLHLLFLRASCVHACVCTGRVVSNLYAL